ncbi:unnamed protein product [Orchesella dallaii]|uniref:Monocarboxylate transporter 10 n=1 Tax=Orchesella dallaii TaxID=48710 RepID=A0ABP1QU26_9HEXA
MMMASSASFSGQSGDMNERNQNPKISSNKKGPLIHSHLHQNQSTTGGDPNVFSIDRTFSATSTDIQPSFDVFDEHEEELEDDDDDDLKSRLRKKSGGGGGGGQPPKKASSFRPDLNRKDVPFYRRHETKPKHETNIGKSSHPKYSSKSNPPSSSSGAKKFSGSSSKMREEAEKVKSYYSEQEDSIGVPSDISGMLQDSEVLEDEEDRKSGEGLNGGAPSNNNDESKNGSTNTGSTTSTNSTAEGRRKNMKSSMISDGKFGSVSSSFSSAAAAAIASGYSGGGGANNNDIFNERLERFQRYTRGPYAPLDRCNSTSVSSAHSSTITQHYYPEGGWGYVVLATAVICHALMYGMHLSAGIFILDVLTRFGEDLVMSSVWMMSLSMGISLFLSPLWVSICQRRSTRLTAVFGGLVTSLACLFTSFASQFHQTFISFGIILSIGIGLSRDASYLMVGQYFKRRRDFVEIFLVAACGLGILVMTLVIKTAISGLGWRFGLQAVTGGIFTTFFLGTCYRSASLYHPQRRAILHLKNQKRKIKEKGKRSDRPPFLDFSCLSSRSLQLLILSTAFTAFGSYSPLFHLAVELTQLEELPTTQVIHLYLYIGAGWILGSCIFGITVVQRNEDCRISKPYLYQGSTLVIGGALFALATLQGNHGLGSFCWIYGFGLGSYNYVLKAWTYEKTRAKNFARAWSFVQCAQGLGCILGVPATGYVNYYAGLRSGYFMSSASVFFSAGIMFCCGMKRRQLMRNKSGTSSMKTCETFDSSGMQSPTVRRISFTFPDEQISPRLLSKGSSRSGSGYGGGGNGGASVDRHSCGGSVKSYNGNNSFSGAQHHHHQQQQPLLLDQPQARMPKELTCISEEGVEPHGPV